MKYKWWLTALSVFIFNILVYVAFSETANIGVAIETDVLWGEHIGNAVSTWHVEQAFDAAQENSKQIESVNQYVGEMVSEMSLEQKLAQMMILTNEEDMTVGKLKTYQPGGIILFSKDFSGKTVEQVGERIKELQEDMTVPLVIGVDEEGGSVSRVAGMQGEEIPTFQSARQLYEIGGVLAVYDDTVTKTRFLDSMGINLNFAPVADVVEKEGAYMYERSASGQAEEVADYVETVVEIMKQEHMVCCLKHFPGYGENVNTHNLYTADKKELSAYQNKDFIPFDRGIAAGADMIMVSHIVMEAVDKDRPASLSQAVHTLIREELGFEGVIMADDLNMQAVLSRMNLEDAAAEALVAGNDMIFSADFMATMEGSQKAVEEGRLSEQQINEAVTRILKMKVEQGLLTVPERN